ncbi:MAG: electron transfer flavoprotein subunit beta/FixA family protein [Actinobacteria bacterium]|nr:electron transfer flavoprotein subunit beta/FixA family protein [Actinomycetota bacterium]
MLKTKENTMDKILVCLKQVPNTNNVKIDPENHTLIREGEDSILNPYDDYALEEALVLKRIYGTKVATMTMGPPQAIDILKYSIRRGADEAFLLTDIRLAGSDTLATALAVVALIKKINYKNIFCGQESVDSGTGHIGSSIAELLGIPQINYTKKIMEISSGKIKVLAKFDRNDAVIEAELPVVISFLKKDKRITQVKNKEINTGIIKKYNLNDIDLNPEYVGLDGSATRVVNIDIDERFVEYVTVDINLKANERIKVILNGGITVKKDRKIIKDLSKSAITELAGLIK